MIFNSHTMKTKRILAGMMLCCGIASSAFAQVKEGESITMTQVDTIQVTNHKERVITKHFWDNWFVSGGFGGQIIFGNHDKQVKFLDRVAPALDIAVGKWFTPGIGVRLMYSGLSVKGATQKEGHGEFPTHSTGVDVPGKGGDGYWLMKQKFKFYNLHLDALFNMSNILCYADKGTGSIERNVILSKNRARVVYECLVNEFGVPKKQLRVDHKGGVDNMFYNDPRLSRAVIISKYNE